MTFVGLDCADEPRELYNLERCILKLHTSAENLATCLPHPNNSLHVYRKALTRARWRHRHSRTETANYCNVCFERLWLTLSASASAVLA